MDDDTVNIPPCPCQDCRRTNTAASQDPLGQWRSLATTTSPPPIPLFPWDDHSYGDKFASPLVGSNVGVIPGHHDPSVSSQQTLSGAAIPIEYEGSSAQTQWRMSPPSLAGEKNPQVSWMQGPSGHSTVPTSQPMYSSIGLTASMTDYPQETSQYPDPGQEGTSYTQCQCGCQAQIVGNSSSSAGFKNPYLLIPTETSGTVSPRSATAGLPLTSEKTMTDTWREANRRILNSHPKTLAGEGDDVQHRRR